MHSSRRRAMTWTLVALGILIVALGGMLIATFPWQQAGWPSAGWTQGGPQAGVPPAGYPGPWSGHPYGWGYLHGPRFFGGGLLILLLVILAVSLFVRRGRHWRYERRDGGLDAEEILRRTFAEGRITEEEYTSRLRALRK
jgi:uncharacterized membrane protein